MKLYIYEIWNEFLKDCYHECGAIETISDAVYESQDECESAAKKEVNRLQKMYDEPEKFYYEIRELDVRPNKVERIDRMLAELDSMQEENDAQNNSELMHEIGEAMGALENAYDILKENK